MRIRDGDYNIGYYNRRSEVSGQWSEASGRGELLGSSLYAAGRLKPAV